MRLSWVALVAVFGGLTAAPPPVAGGQAPAPRYHEALAGTLVRFEMVLVPGAPLLYVGRTEVTWDLYDVFALGLDVPAGGGADATARPSNPYGAPDRGWGHAGFPAMSVTRAAAQAFCQWLTAKTGRSYRLPTDAEWDRVATLAAGGAALTPDRARALAWSAANAERRTHSVGERTADALDLFDLFGNVAEWVETADGSLVTRGGSYRDDLAAVGPRARAVQDPSWNDTDPQLPKSRWWLSDGPFVGFRVVSSVPSFVSDFQEFRP